MTASIGAASRGNEEPRISVRELVSVIAAWALTAGCGAESGVIEKSAGTGGSIGGADASTGNIAGAGGTAGSGAGAMGAMGGSEGTGAAGGTGSTGGTGGGGGVCTGWMGSLDCEHEDEKCEAGKAGNYGCRSVDLLARLIPADLGGTGINDMWGWVDQETCREFAVVGLRSSTAFVDISDPLCPVFLGSLPSPVDGADIHHDIKVYKDHAFIVAEMPGHGMQVINLEQMLDVKSPQEFSADVHYTGFGESHNIALNEASGFAYAVRTTDADCTDDVQIIDIRDPLNPKAAGCFGERIHDLQCVIYSGPDVKYTGAEICVTNDYDAVSVWDVSDKENPIELASKGYPNADLAHQGWFTEDQRYFIMGDEGDELNGLNTTTYIWDLSHLETPVLRGTYVADLRATDHNLYIEGNYVYQANYSSGLRILSIEDLSVPRLSEHAYFDAYLRDDDAGYNGAWSVFPYYASDTVAVSSSSGLFLLRPTFATE